MDILIFPGVGGAAFVGAGTSTVAVY